MNCRQLLLVALCLGSSTAARAAENTPDAKELIRRVLERDDGTTLVARVRISTCRYTRQGKTLVCSEEPREKLMQQFSKDYGRDGRGLSIVVEPAAEKGIGFVQYDYDAEDRESDQWIYLSALGKVRRIAAGNTDQPKTGSFFGSEITFEDMERRKLHHFSYRILQKEAYAGRDCWVVESEPLAEYRRRTSYAKRWEWIDAERNLALKRILFDRRGNKVKRITSRNLREQDGVWLVGRMEVNNLTTGRISTITWESTLLNADIDDEFLTQRSLTDRAFRERLLTQFEGVLAR